MPRGLVLRLVIISSRPVINASIRLRLQGSRHVLLDNPKTQYLTSSVAGHTRDLDPHHNCKANPHIQVQTGPSRPLPSHPSKTPLKIKIRKKKKKDGKKMKLDKEIFSHPPACPLAHDQKHSGSLVLGLLNLGRRVPPLPRLRVNLGLRRSRRGARGRRVARRGADARLSLRVADPGRGALLLLLLLGLGLAYVSIKASNDG